MIDELTRQLFGKFPREVANPRRTLIFDIEGLKDFLKTNEGFTDCYTSVLPRFEKTHIDKIYMDFDYHPGLCTLEQAVIDSNRVYEYMTNAGHRTIPIVSGRKGINHQTMLDPIEFDDQLEAKEALYRASLKILEDVFGRLEQGSEKDALGKSVQVFYAIEEDNRILGTDPVVMGDVRRICRIPNTRRPPENLSWCTYLPETYTTFSILELIRWMKSPKYRDRVSPPVMSLDDMPKSSRKIPDPRVTYDTNFPVTSRVNPLLMGALRPCLYRAIMEPNPTHPARVAVAIDLLRMWGPKDVVDVFSQLGWVDFTYDDTFSQVMSVSGRQPFSCEKAMKRYGLCNVKNQSDCSMFGPISIEHMVEGL